jgi:geranylgeranyl diphosphate synthase type II
VGSAIAYSLAASGKRYRPALVLGVYRELGGAGSADDIAAAVEIVHTYSLVHDDLPCMDDDDLRRGIPTVHLMFGVSVAAEAGFRMLPLAARALAEGAGQLGLPAEVLGAMARELFGAAGVRGMIGGQVLDLEAEGRPVSGEELHEIHRRKTGALIAASAVLGAMAADATGPCVDAIRAFGEEVGLAFQIADDVLDATETSEQLGKTAGKDQRQQKATFTKLVGPRDAMALAREHVGRAIDQLKVAGIDSKLLSDLALFIVSRRS